MPTARRLSRRIAVVATLLFCVAPAPAAGQSAARAFSVYLDCSGFSCEPDFYRTDIAFVDHVRERTAADVHVLVTRETTGGGGTAFTLAFYGQRRFAGLADTLRADTPQGATEDVQRRTLSRVVKLGLARYLARTPEGARTTIAVAAAPDADAIATPKRDPWNAWVFRVGANVNASRERDYGSNDLYGSVNASRVTEQWKTNLRLSEHYNDQNFSFDGERVSSVRRDYGGALQLVRSLAPQYSAGIRATAGSSTYLNQALFISAGPAIEFNVFPYRESTRHVWAFLYSAGVNHFRYTDTTLYFMTRETLPYQSLTMNLAQKQTWGSVSLEVKGSQYLNDPGKSRLTFHPEADVRLLKGLELNLFGNYSVLHDQIYLPKGALTREEVLLRGAQVATSYTAYLYLGLSYTFGSVLNNVVNPRFSSPSSEF